MDGQVFRSTQSERLRFIAFLAFFVICALGGGASREDAFSLLYLRPFAIIILAAIFLSPGTIDFRSFKVPLALLAALGAAIAIQLVPLPPDIWASLPGRARFAEAAAAAGLAQPWRPITLTPDHSWNSILALLPAFLALTALAGVREDRRFAVLPALIILACASAVLGVAQITTGANSAAYLYRITHNGFAVGFFANRNHEAVLLALTFPMLRMWTLMPSEDFRYRRYRTWCAAAIAIFLIPMILVTGSRAGMALGVASILLTYFMAPPEKLRAPGVGIWRKLSKAAILLVPLALAAAVVLLGRAIALERLTSVDAFQEELRVQYTPLMLRMTQEFFPFGTGFGSFDSVFRGREPDAMLSPIYFNHAHNDLIELALTGGLPALAVLGVFLVWWGRASIRSFRPYRTRGQRALFARLGAIMILILLLASLVDYPLRTPLMSVVFAVATVWLAGLRKQAHRDRSEQSQASQ